MPHEAFEFIDSILTAPVGSRPVKRAMVSNFVVRSRLEPLARTRCWSCSARETTIRETVQTIGASIWWRAWDHIPHGGLQYWGTYIVALGKRTQILPDGRSSSDEVALLGFGPDLPSKVKAAPNATGEVLRSQG